MVTTPIRHKFLYKGNVYGNLSEVSLRSDINFSQNYRDQNLNLSGMDKCNDEQRVTTPIRHTFLINGIGIEELMRPGMVDRPRGTGDWLIMYFPVSCQIMEQQAPDRSLVIWSPGDYQNMVDTHPAGRIAGYIVMVLHYRVGLSRHIYRPIPF